MKSPLRRDKPLEKIAITPDKHKNYRDSIKNKYYLHMIIKLKILDIKKC